MPGQAVLDRMRQTESGGEMPVGSEDAATAAECSDERELALDGLFQ
ncbi:hypothetical protein [Thiorhodococcus mannitoliphagus]|nr:hypothetical protein [Thiorhodococcus mannitoliphagus]